MASTNTSDHTIASSSSRDPLAEARNELEWLLVEELTPRLATLGLAPSVFGDIQLMEPWYTDCVR